jgi:hypothetical protein
MNDIAFLVSLFFGSAIGIYLLWFVCHYNGKVLFYYLCALVKGSANRNNRRFAPENDFYNDISMASICVTGAMPLAFLSILTAALNNCFNSIYATGILELSLTIPALFIPAAIKQQFDLFGVRLLRKNRSVVLYSLLWCACFAIWATLNHQVSFDRMISNTNPDMWAYVRRIAAWTTDRLSFNGGSDSFTFRDNSACAFLVGSPKKFSSFLGSLISYPFQGSSLGIAVFQGTLGGIVLICLFWEWMEVRWSKIQGVPLEAILCIAWVLSSPPLYWLMISAYFSNAIFVIVTALTLREARQVAIAAKIDTPENLIFFGSILTIVFSFYPAFLPIIILVYATTLWVYVPRDGSIDKTGIILKFAAVTVGCGLIFGFLFPSQLGLYEVRKSLDFAREHGANFVPLNPWSLLQEKPKPMPSAKDFGVYINVIIGLLFSIVLARKLFNRYRSNQSRDLLAGMIGLSLYSGYLLAHIPLESTYRLMKIVISIIYPLAIFGLLPLIQLGRSQLAIKPVWMYRVTMALVALHVVLHIHKTFDLRAFPTGDFVVSNASQLPRIQRLAIVGCKGVHKSQFYERLVGLQLARRYPHLTVTVFRSSDYLDASIKTDLIIYGTAIPNKSTQSNTCHFSL